MLTRKGSCAGLMAADRTRVGERLQAALAGLQELHLLRERQGQRVDWALGAHTEEPSSVGRTGVKHRAGNVWGETRRTESLGLGVKEERSRSAFGDVELMGERHRCSLKEMELMPGDVFQSPGERQLFSPREMDLMPGDVFQSPSERHQFSPEEVQLMGAEEQRLEATLAALKQQLSRLRRQDVGLKSHLQILDQQIHELKLDVNKVTSDKQETDSRPSSGFYDLSDGGSGSLSNSCTSLYSASISPVTSTVSPVTSVTPTLTPNLTSAVSPTVTPTGTTADGSAHHRVKAPHLGSSWIRTDKPRPRPVSTGDLDRVMAQTQNCSEHVDICKNLMFHYPSPLHAVALRSPAHCDPGDRTLPLDGSLRRLTSYDSKTENYIEKILQRGLGNLHFPTTPREAPASNNVILQALPLSPGPSPSLSPSPSPSFAALQTVNTVPRAEPNDHQRRLQGLQDKPPHGRESSSDEHAKTTPRMPHHVHTASSSPSPSPCDVIEPRRDRRTTKQQRSTTEKVQTQHASTHPDSPKCMTCQSSSAEEAGLNSTLEAGLSVGSSPSPEFVHARFVPAGSQRVKARQSKTSKPKKKIWTKDWSSRAEKKKPHSRGHARATSITPKTTQWRHAAENSVLHQSQSYDIIDQRRRRHMDLQHSHVMYPLSPAPSSHTLRSPASNSHMVRSLSVRAGPWLTSAASRYLSSPYHMARPSPRCDHMTRPPPRCESEYSAECASLFHSTIAASSEGELSDHTANRFGDSETTDSEEEWEEPALCPAPGQAPSSCRIKASRALKKKIRRFQPDALKVMTLV